LVLAASLAASGMDWAEIQQALYAESAYAHGAVRPAQSNQRRFASCKDVVSFRRANTISGTRFNRSRNVLMDGMYGRAIGVILDEPLGHATRWRGEEAHRRVSDPVPQPFAGQCEWSEQDGKFGGVTHGDSSKVLCEQRGHSASPWLKDPPDPVHRIHVALAHRSGSPAENHELGRAGHLTPQFEE
jgi:hypothetical protein